MNSARLSKRLNWIHSQPLVVGLDDQGVHNHSIVSSTSLPRSLSLFPSPLSPLFQPPSPLSYLSSIPTPSPSLLPLFLSHLFSLVPLAIFSIALLLLYIFYSSYLSFITASNTPELTRSNISHDTQSLHDPLDDNNRLDQLTNKL